LGPQPLWEPADGLLPQLREQTALNDDIFFFMSPDWHFGHLMFSAFIE
jgi:hypothetical protein